MGRSFCSTVAMSSSGDTESTMLFYEERCTQMQRIVCTCIGLCVHASCSDKDVLYIGELEERKSNHEQTRI